MTLAAEPIEIDVGEFMPDMPQLGNPGSANIVNVRPATPTSYGPMPSLDEFSSALNTRCQGAFGLVDASQVPHIFLGDSQDLYLLQTGSTTPAIVSKASHPYTISANDLWNFAAFGARVVAANLNDPLQSYLIGTSSLFADLANGGVTSLAVNPGTGYTNGLNYALTASGGGGTGFTGLVDVAGGALTNARITASGSGFTSVPTINIAAGAGSGTGGITATVATIAPRAKYLAIIAGFLMAAFTTDSASGTQAQRAWWSTFNDPTSWPIPGTTAAVTALSSFTDVFGSFGQCTGLVGGLGTADGAMFFQRAIYRILFTTPPQVFAFLPAEGARGTSIPGSIVQLGTQVYYIADDGFYRFDGSNSYPIGANKVDQWFLKNVDKTNLGRINSAVDPVNKLIMWAVPFAGNINGSPNTLILYNWQLDRFAYCNVTLDMLLRAVTFGVTLDQLNTVLGFTLDAVPAPLSSAVWVGGAQLMGGVDTAFKFGYFNGPNLAPIVETTEIEANPGFLTFIGNTRPLVDGGVPSVRIARRNRFVDNPVYAAKTALNALGYCPQRASGRYLRGEISLPAGSVFTHIKGLQAYGKRMGGR